MCKPTDYVNNIHLAKNYPVYDAASDVQSNGPSNQNLVARQSPTRNPQLDAIGYVPVYADVAESRDS